VPSSIISQIQAQLDNLRLLPLAVMVPGLFAALFLLLGAVCPMSKARKGSYCCTKCMIFFADILLLLALVFYAIFAAFSIVFQSVPQVKEPLGEIRATCDVLPLSLKQMVGDNLATIDKLDSMGADVADIQKTLTELSDTVLLIDQGCGFVNSFIGAMVGMFFPGVMCVIAIIFAMFVNQTLCCAAGCCCKGPPKADAPKMTKTNPKAGDDTIQAV
jgi:hypothetical protein